jgi:hypothetical protein
VSETKLKKNQVLLRHPVDVDPGRRSQRYLRRVDHRNQCDRLYGFVAMFVLHSNRTDFAGRGLPEFPIVLIIQPTCRNCLICKRIGHKRLILTLCID